MTKQEKLEKIGQECILELNSINIFPEQICSWNVNTRAKRRWGNANIKEVDVISILTNVFWKMMFQKKV